MGHIADHTQFDKRVAQLAHDGKTIEEIAIDVGASHKTVHNSIKRSMNAGLLRRTSYALVEQQKEHMENKIDRLLQLTETQALGWLNLPASSFTRQRCVCPKCETSFYLGDGGNDFGFAHTEGDPGFKAKKSE